jgi:hypothetical protein
MKRKLTLADKQINLSKRGIVETVLGEGQKQCLGSWNIQK